MPKRCSIAVYPTRRDVLEGVQYLAIGCYLQWCLTKEGSSDSRCRIRPAKMAIAIVLYMNRRFRIDKVALVYDECTKSRLVCFTQTMIRAFTTKVLSLTLG